MDINHLNAAWLDERVEYFFPEAEKSIARLAEHNKALSEKATALLNLLSKARTEPETWCDKYCKEATRLWKSLRRSVDARIKSLEVQRKKLQQRKKPVSGFGREEIESINAMLCEVRPLLLSFPCLEIAARVREFARAVQRQELKLRSDQLDPVDTLLAKVQRGVGSLLIKVKRVENMELCTLLTTLNAASKPTAWVNNEVAARIRALAKHVELVREVLPPAERNGSLEGAGIRVVPAHGELLGV